MHKHVADANSSCTECRARGLLAAMAKKAAVRRETAKALWDADSTVVDLTAGPRPAIQSQSRMRKPRRADQDENLRNDVAGMIADMCLPAEVLGPRLMDGAHQIVVVVREHVLREIESYARENIR